MGSWCITQGAQHSTMWQSRWMRWGGGWGEGSRERGHVYLWLTHVVVWQKLTQNCKAVIPQLKKKKINSFWVPSLPAFGLEFTLSVLLGLQFTRLRYGDSSASRILNKPIPYTKYLDKLIDNQLCCLENPNTATLDKSVFQMLRVLSLLYSINFSYS